MTKADRPINQRPTARALRAAVARSGMTYPALAKQVGMNSETLRDWCHYRPLTIYNEQPDTGRYALPGEMTYAHRELIERICVTLKEDVCVHGEFLTMWDMAAREEPLNLFRFQTEFLAVGLTIDEIEALNAKEHFNMNDGLEYVENVEIAFEVLARHDYYFGLRWSPESFGDSFEYLETP